MVNLTIAASDPDVGDTLTFSASGLPAGLTINPGSGLISGTPGTAGVSNVTVTVTDGEDNASASFTWTLVAPNNAPTITNPGDQSGMTGQAVNLTIAASDPDVGDTLTFSASGLPAGLSINPSSGLISGTPTVAGGHSVTVTVSDSEDSASTTFTLVDCGAEHGAFDHEPRGSERRDGSGGEPDDRGERCRRGHTDVQCERSAGGTDDRCRDGRDQWHAGYGGCQQRHGDGHRWPGQRQCRAFTWTLVAPGTLDFNVYVTESYANQDQDASVSVEDGGATIVLSDNTWRRTVQTFDISAATVLEFDFEAIGEAEVMGIGFDSNNAITAGRVFKLFGSQGASWDIEDFETYTGSGVTHYRIPVGQYYTGAAMNLVFVND